MPQQPFKPISNIARANLLAREAEQDAQATHQSAEPTQEGWYQARGASSWELYSLCDGVWRAHSLNGDCDAIAWRYIDKSGGIELVAPWPRPAA